MNCYTCFHCILKLLYLDFMEDYNFNGWTWRGFCCFNCNINAWDTILKILKRFSEFSGIWFLIEQKLSRLDHVPRLKDVWCEKALQFKGFNFLQLSKDTMTSTYSTCLCFFNGGETRKDFGNDRPPHSNISTRNSFNGRRWTNMLLAVNVLWVSSCQTRIILAWFMDTIQ